jgi:hypothetical protein
VEDQNSHCRGQHKCVIGVHGDANQCAW